MNEISIEDVAALRDQGDLHEYFLRLLGRAPDPAAAEPVEAKPDYHIPRPGAWPCGTAPSGPTPPPCGTCP